MNFASDTDETTPNNLAKENSFKVKAGKRKVRITNWLRLWLKSCIIRRHCPCVSQGCSRPVGLSCSTAHSGTINIFDIGIS